MKLKNSFASLLLAAVVMLSLAACKAKVKDADVKVAVETAIAVVPGVKAEVTEGVVTLTGTVADEAAKLAAENAAKTAKDVKSVTNNIAVVPPVIAEDTVLVNGISAVVANYKTVTSSIKDGIVTLTGEIKKADLPKLLQEVTKLNPKKIDNQLTIK